MAVAPDFSAVADTHGFMSSAGLEGGYRPTVSCGHPEVPVAEGPSSVVKEILQAVNQALGRSSSGGQIGFPHVAAQLTALPQRRTAGATPPEGSWVCVACRNVNWPTRDHCNGRSCGLPRSEVDAGPPLPVEAVPQRPSVAQPPEGAWTCSVCANVNWPTRDHCNGRNCGLHRSAVDAGPPPSREFPQPRQTEGHGQPPEGAWACSVCMNVNWPTRDHCNGRDCGLPRSEVDAGPPPALISGETWLCPVCGNVNLGSRLVCNKRECRIPRPGAFQQI